MSRRLDKLRAERAKAQEKLAHHQALIDEESQFWRTHSKKAAKYRRIIDNINARITAELARNK
jgi:hypothetical protein